jgi:quinol monooxygenase YgiN
MGKILRLLFTLARLCVSTDALALRSGPRLLRSTVMRSEAKGQVQPAVPLFCLNVQLEVKFNRRAEFLECIYANQRGTLTTEKLAVAYLVGEDAKTPNMFHFFEAYIGKQGFIEHSQSPHFAAWEVFAGSNPFTAPPKVAFYVEDCVSKLGLASVKEGNSTFGLVVRLCVKNERRGDFLAAMRADQRGALTTEPLAVTYLFGEDTETPNVFHMFERYLSRAGFEEHAKSPSYQAWAAFKATDPFSEPTQVKYLNIES